MLFRRKEKPIKKDSEIEQGAELYQKHREESRAKIHFNNSE